MRRVTLVALAFLLSVVPGFGDTLTGVRARKVQDQIRLRLSGSGKALVLEHRIDRDATWKRVPRATSFTASGPILLTYPSFNPLRVRVTAKITELDDPSAAAIDKLIQAMTDAALVIKPLEKPKVSGLVTESECAELKHARTISQRLFDDLYKGLTPSELQKTFEEVWAKTIDTQPGVSGVVQAKALIEAFAKETKNRLEDAKKAADDLAAMLQKPRERSDPCESQAYDLLLLLAQTAPHVRIEMVKPLAASIAAIAEGLAPFAEEAAWERDEKDALTIYRVATITPNDKKIQQLEIQAARLAYEAGISGFSLKTSAAEPAAMTVQFHRALIAEVGVGAVISELRRPRYGTATDATGHTIVARASDEAVSLDAAVLVNLVMRKDLGIGAPMLQVGALASKDSPGFLVGGGIRLFGDKSFSFAVGWVHAWVRDFTADGQGIQIGSRVSGTKDIEEALKLRPRDKVYFAVHYKF